MSNGSTCTTEQLAQFHSSHSTGASIVCLTRSDSIGLTLVAEAGFISLIAVLAAFVLIFSNAFRHRRLIRNSMDIYMLSLFTFDIIMALGRVVDIKWIHEAKLYTGGFCTAQGIIQQLGETGSALATFAIAVHTFIVVIWDIRLTENIAYVVVGLTWIFITWFIAMTVTNHTQGGHFYETPVGYWCWIGTHFTAEQKGGQYVWVWITVFVSFLTYTPLFFWARGNISISEQHWWKFRTQRSIDAQQHIDPNVDHRWRAVRMIAYPIVFAFTTLPLSVVRFKSGFGSTRGNYHTITFVVEFIYSLSGAFNVLLFLFTRSNLLLPHNRLGLAPGPMPHDGRTGTPERLYT